QRLAQTGATIRVAVRDTEAAQFLKPLGEVGSIVPIWASLNDADSVARAVDGADQVVNLVGILFERGKATFQAIHAEGAATVAKAAKAAGVKRLVHLSAIGADKDSPSAYARTKAEGEAAVLDAFPEASVLRPSVVFGPEDDFFNQFAGLSRLTWVLPVFGCPTIPKVTLFPEDGIIDIDLYGDGGTRFQPVYVGDVADAIVKALHDTNASGKTYELGGPRVYSFKQVMELMLAEIDRKRFLMPVPFGLAAFIGWFTEFMPKPLLTRDQVKLLRSDNVAGDKMPGLNDLGVTPTPAEAILPTYLHRFRTPARQRARFA
ncbi:MAG: complex I NDUFA9 subunit family protein, partial [Rhodospirillales bacterium]|nr:complex I NDUFA9 subunit family protein [Rhodospirillales bacterium]